MRTCINHIRRIASSIANHRGQTLVEFALVIPIVIVFLALIFDFGVALNRKIIFTNAARESARYASLGFDTDESDIAQIAVNQSQGVFTTGDVEIFWVDQNGDGAVRTGEPVVVKINYTYSPDILGGVSGLMPGLTVPDVDLSACADMALGQDVTGVTVTGPGEAPCGG
jgi:Flp pilus assembly protein TadG